jgi:DNA/RNA-binding domain of Phe-tRNA-synthetase-like protein
MAMSIISEVNTSSISSRFPHYRGVMIYARRLENRPSDEFSSSLLSEAETNAQALFATGKVSEHPHIQAWREAFAAFGVKPSKMLNSAEALISRVLKGNELPRINWLADVYNAISVLNVIPIGGEDLDKAVGMQRLEFARGDEPFDTTKDGASFIDHPQPGEVIWRDDAGVTCRAWNWRQCVRTRLTEHTRNAYFVFDSLEPFTRTHLEIAANELEEYLKRLSPNCELERLEIGAQS